MYTAVREDGISIVTYRRTLNSCKLAHNVKEKCRSGELYGTLYIVADPGDKEYPTNRPVYVIWALGRLDENKEPTFHDVYPKSDLKLELVPEEPENTCMDFTETNEKLM